MIQFCFFRCRTTRLHLLISFGKL